MAAQPSGVSTGSGFGCSRQQKRHAATPPPARVQRRMERNRQKPVGRDKGSLTEQQTKGTAATTIQKKGNTQNKPAEQSPQSTAALSPGPNCRCALLSHGSVPAAPPPPLEPSMMAHGMEYPALFCQVGSAHPAVPLPGFLSWIPVKINPVLAKPRTPPLLPVLSRQQTC